MARAPEYRVDYFPHRVARGKKMFYIENKYQNDGYATWYKILEALGETEYHYLDINSEMNIMFLQDKCKVSKDKLLLIISDLVKLEEFDEQLYSIGILFNSKFIESVADAYRKRANNILRIDGVLNVLRQKGYDLSSIYPEYSGNLPEDCRKNTLQIDQSTAGNTQRKGKERKEEERKEEERKGELSFSDFQSPDKIENDSIVFLVGDEIVQQKKSEIIDDVAKWFEMDGNHFHKEKSAIMRFVNLLDHEGLFVHFQIQWESYKAFKHLTGNRHTLFGFIGFPDKNFENAKWNSANWAGMLEIHLNAVPAPVLKKHGIQDNIDIINRVVNPFSPENE